MLFHLTNYVSLPSSSDDSICGLRLVRLALSRFINALAKTSLCNILVPSNSLQETAFPSSDDSFSGLRIVRLTSRAHLVRIRKDRAGYPVGEKRPTLTPARTLKLPHPARLNVVESIEGSMQVSLSFARIIDELQRA